jgi:HEAT repeat protein
MKSSKADQEIIRVSRSSGPEAKAELIRAIGYRKIEAGLQYTIGQISDSNSKVRLAAIETAGMIGTRDDLNEVKNRSLTGVISEAEVIVEALTRISLNSGDPDWCADEINASFATFSNESPMIILISTLGNIGTDTSLGYIRPFLSYDSYEIQFAALKALSTWQNDAPLPFLEEYLKTSDKDKNRQMAQVGIVNLVQNSGKLTSEEKSEKLEISFLSAQSKAEKVIVLNGISRIYSLRAMDFVISQLTNPDLSTTAQEAFIRIADNLKYSYETTVIEKIDSIADYETDEGFSAKLKLLKRSIEL